MSDLLAEMSEQTGVRSLDEIKRSVEDALDMNDDDALIKALAMRVEMQGDLIRMLVECVRMLEVQAINEHDTNKQRFADIKQDTPYV